MPKLTKRVIDAVAPGERRLTVWCSDLSGFGCRVEPSGRRTFIVRYRTGSGGRGAQERLISIGPYGTLTAEEARERAKDILARVRLGGDPGGERAEERAGLTLSELIDTFMTKEVRPTRKASTANLYDLYFRVHVLPDLGTRKAASITRADVARLHRRIGTEAPVTANRVLMALSGAFSWAREHDEVTEGANPCTGIKRFAEQGRERFLTEEEIGRLAEAIREAETVGIPWEPDPGKAVKHAPKEVHRRTRISPYAGAAIRLLLLTGCRLREILHLRWQDVDVERGLLFLPDSKTGRKTVWLNAPALAILSGLTRVSDYVVAGDDPKKPRHDLHRPWALVSRRAGLGGVRLHDLRHTHASIGAGAGLSLPIIGALLGHRQVSTTQRYAHLADDPVRRASNSIGARIAAAMGEDTPETGAEVVPLAGRRA